MPTSMPPLISRLRASSRLCIMVLALFVLKIGMASACANHDLLKQLSTTEQTLQIDSSDDGGNSSVDKDPSDPNKAPPTSCSDCDCNCHHANAMLPLEVNMTMIATQTKYFSITTYFHQIAPRSNLRPPIL